MKSHLALLLLASLTVTSAFAAQTSTFGSLWTKLKASPASLTLSVLADSARDADNQVRGLDFYSYLLGSWKFTPVDDIRISPEWITAYRPTQYYGGSTPNTQTTFSSVEFRYRRKNILTEDEHGTNLQFQIRYAYQNNHNVNDAIISNRLYFNNQLTAQVGLLNYLRLDVYQHNKDKVLFNSTRDRTSRFRYYIWPSLAINDSFSVAAYLRYEYAWYESQSTLAKTSAVQFTPSMSWSIDAYNSLAVYAFANIAVNDDGYTLARPFNQFQDEIIYELEYSLAMF